LLVVLDGEVWCGPQNLAVTLDNLIADNLIEPPLALLVDSGGRDHRWAELDGSGAAPAWIADKLVPWALAGLRPASPLAPVRGAAGGEVGLGLGETASDTGGEAAAFVVVAGQSLGALTALRAALERGDVVRGAIAQSASLWQRDLGAGLAGRDLSGLRAYVEVGAQEWVLREPNRRLAQHLAAAGANVHFNEYNGGHDYACWRGGIADALRWMLPPRI
jgi:enterochelin esterase family protein